MDRIFSVINRFLFYNYISEIVNNKTLNCPRHDFKSFCVCNMNFKFDTTDPDSVKQYKKLRMREIKANFPHSENCPVPS